jgi:paraquat-inducible protein B
VVYFDGSVFGLNVGSRVMFRGVPIGYVSEINVMADFDDMRFAVPVYINIVTENIRQLNPGNGDRRLDIADDIQPLIDLGLRASLNTESMITGQLYIDLDFYPDTPVILRGVNNKLTEIPSTPSGIQEVIKKAQRFAADIQQNIDIPKLTASLTSTLEGLEQLITNPETQQLTGELNKTLAAIQQTVGRLDTAVDSAGGEIAPLASSLADTLGSAQEVLATAESKLANDSDIAYRLGVTLQEIEAAARAVRALANELEAQPESVIRGRK